MQTSSADILLLLIEALRLRDSWCGETHVQKSMYCLKEITNTQVEYPFVLYKHGPYSFELHDEIGLLHTTGLIGLKTNQPPYGPTLVVTDGGRQALAQSALRQDTELTGKIDFTASNLGDKGVAALERLSTALMITREHPGKDRTMRANDLVARKPHVAIEQAQDAVDEIDRILAAYRERFPTA